MKIKPLFGHFLCPKVSNRTLNIMKVFIFAMFVCAFQLYASPGNAQNATIELPSNSLTVETLFSEIERQTEYLVVYSSRELDVKTTVTLSSNTGKVCDILNELLKNTNLKYEHSNNYIVFSKTDKVNSQQQNKKRVTGNVTDTNGEPVIGASVLEKGTTNGTITDFEGNFELNIQGSTLVVSFIGYQTQEIAVDKKSSVKVILKEDSEMLDEIVVVGFGSQKKVNLTGAVATVSADVFEGRPVQNATMMLQGAIPGLNISKGTGKLDEAPSINIRGIGTIGKDANGEAYSNASPLILIDGMEGDLNMLNPQDIENISVLKDAAASSIYGSRAPFGVILVTTKSGKKDKLVVNYNNSFRWNTPTKRPHTVDSYRFATYFNDAATNAKKTGHFTPERMQRIKDYMDGKITTVNIPNPTNPTIWADGYDNGNANVDWYDEMYNKWAFSQEHTASVSGGSDKVQMYASFNYMGTDGMIKVSEDTYDRYATNLKVNSQLTNYLSLSYNMKYSRSDFDRPSSIDNINKLGYQTWPMLPVYDDNGYLYDAPSPLMAIREGGRDKTRKDHLAQQLRAVITPLKGWEIVGELNYAINRNHNHRDTQKYYNHNVAGDIIPNDRSTEVYEYNYSNDYMNLNVFSTYSHEFKNGHNMKVMVGFQNESSKNNDFSAKRNGIIVPGMDVIDITNGTDGSGATVPPGVSGSRSQWGVIGFFGRLNYDHKGRYLAEVNIRHDGSSRYRSNMRWKTFPSVSLGWNVAREAFWEDFASFINTLKLRGSYGSLGNQNTRLLYPTYVTLPVGTSNSSWIINGNKQNTANAPGLISTALTWEMVKTFNIGLDTDLLNNRLNLSFDWYQRNTENMTGPAPELPLTLGTGVPVTNNTNLRTRGWEVNVRWRDNLTKDFAYDIAFNLSDEQTEVTKYPNDTYKLDQYYNGQKLGEIWGYETIGIAKTQEEMDRHLASLPNGGQNAICGSVWEAGDIMYKDLNKDGKINNGSNSLNDHGDLKVIGNNTPRFRFGLNLGTSWKGLDLNLFFQGVMKRDYWEGSYNFWGWSGELWRSTAYEEHMDYFRNDPNHYMGLNLDSYYPRPVQGDNDNDKRNLQIQSRYLQNAAYIRLKNIQVGYTLPASLVSRLNISNFRIFISGENLWTGTSLSSLFDPEALGYGSGSIGYPLSKTLSAGVSITL